MDSGIECTLSKAANNIKLSGVVSILEGRDAIQRDLDMLERWACANCMRFNKAKCKVLHMGRDNPKQKYRLGGEWVDSSPEEKDLGMLVDEKINMTRQCHAVSACSSEGQPYPVLACIKINLSNRSREVVLPLCSTLVRSHLEYCIQLCSPHHRKDMDQLEQAQGRATKMIRRLEHLSVRKG